VFYFEVSAGTAENDAQCSIIWPYLTVQPKSHFSAYPAACSRTIFMLHIFILLKLHYILPHCILISTVQLYYVPKVICAALGRTEVQVRKIFLILV
jgi:hypothetical protein